MLAFVLVFSLRIWASENSDLDFIPTLRKQESAPVETTSHVHSRSYVEEALTSWWNRSGLILPVPVNGPTWQSRTSLDSNLKWQADDHFAIHFNNRLNVFFEDGVTFPNRGTARNDLKELYISYEASERTYFEIGRINVRHGVALGFNPTDFFKTRSLVSQVSIDPSSVRENRLGTVAVQAQKIWNQGTFTIGISPILQSATAVSTAKSDFLDLHLGQTNATSRIYAVSTIAWDVLSPELMILSDDIGTHVGVNLSHGIGQSIVAYLEWSGVQSTNLTTRANQFGVSTGTLPTGVPAFPQSSTQNYFQNDVALGASWTSSAKFTLNLEYHFHQSGLSALVISKSYFTSANMGLSDFCN